MDHDMDTFNAFQERAIAWLDSVEPSSSKDFKRALVQGLKLFAGVAGVKKVLQEIADKPRILEECKQLVYTKGLIVPFLPSEALLALYFESYGPKRVEDELKFTVLHRYPMSVVTDRLARYTQNKARERWDGDLIARVTTVLPAHPVLALLQPSATNEPQAIAPAQMESVVAESVLPPAIGINTQLNAIPVESQAVDVSEPVEPISESVPQVSEPAAEPAVALPAIDTLFGASGESWRELFRDGSLSPAVLSMPLHNRAGLILRCLTDSGCDLMPYIGRPTLAAGGKQRSGKTTLIVMMAILEKALGQSVFYVTLDDDVYPVAFDQVASGSKGFWTYSRLAATVTSWGMGALKGSTWILDECTAYALQNKQGAEFLWSTALTGFAKRGGRVRIIAHAKTATGNGVPNGLADTFKSELTFLWTDRKNGTVEVDDDNQVDASNASYTPSGRYQELEFEGASYSKTGSELIIPDWLKFAVNPNWHNAPCPVRSLLEFFPELKAVEQPKTEIKTIIPTSEPDIAPTTPLGMISISTQVQTGQSSPNFEPNSSADDSLEHDGQDAERPVTAKKTANVVELRQQVKANLQKLAKKIEEASNEGIKEWALLKLFRSDRRESGKLLIQTLLREHGDRYCYDAEQEKYYCRTAVSQNSNSELNQPEQVEREPRGRVDEEGVGMDVFETF